VAHGVAGTMPAVHWDAERLHIPDTTNGAMASAAPEPAPVVSRPGFTPLAGPLAAPESCRVRARTEAGIHDGAVAQPPEPSFQ